VLESDVATVALPGEDLVRRGIDDLSKGVESVPALLVSIGAPRLRRLGLPVPEKSIPSPEHRLYQHLSRTDPDAAHSRYNALIRRLVSFERAAECARLADAKRIWQFIRALGAEAQTDSRLYFTGGATAVLLGWRETTIDVDVRFFPESDALFRALPGLKETLQINVELASPSDFIPELSGWQDRSVYITREGKLSFYHYDLYAQALAKIERGHSQDAQDVREMLQRELIDAEEVLRYFEAIEPELYRYPAIDPASFRRAVEASLRTEDD